MVCTRVSGCWIWFVLGLVCPGISKCRGWCALRSVGAKVCVLRVSVYQDWWVLVLVCTELGTGVSWDQ